VLIKEQKVFDESLQSTEENNKMAYPDCSVPYIISVAFYFSILDRALFIFIFDC